MHADRASFQGDEAAPVIRVDGGMSASDWTMQFLADMLDALVDRPAAIEKDRTRRRVSRRVAGRALSGPRGVRADLASATRFYAIDADCGA
jgi:hypothetical protein